MENTDKSKPRNFAKEAHDKMFSMMAEMIDNAMASEFERVFINRHIAPWYIRLRNDIADFIFYKMRKPITNAIERLKYNCTKTINIRPACGSLDEAMARSGKIRNTKDFANWIRKEVPWLEEYKSFHCELYSDEEDERIGWCKTYILLYHDDKDEKSYPFAYTDKDIIKLLHTDNIQTILRK